MTAPDLKSDYLRAACLLLAVIQTVMLASLYFDVDPHPPRSIAPFAMAPFLAVSIGVTLCVMQLAHTVIGRGLSVLAALLALLSFGPQKYFDPALPVIWIAVVTAQMAVFAIFAVLIQGRGRLSPG